MEIVPEDYTNPAILQSLAGGEAARLLTIATLALLVYDWLITLDDEIKCFWSGRWSISRMLFLANRYTTPIVIFFPLYCFQTTTPTLLFCQRSIQACIVLTALVLGIVQAILVLRVYYLFSNSTVVRNGVMVCFAVSVTLTLVYACIAASQLRGLMPLVAFGIKGCRAERPKGFWRLYLPPMVLHTILYMLTVVRALRNRQMLKKSPVMQRLLKDGGFFYFVAFISFGFSAIGSFMYGAPHINIPAIFSNFVLGITSVCVSHIMLSIQSLAAKLGSDTAWLLNNVELSRVRWRHGEREGELIVDLDPAYEEEEEHHQQDIEYNRRMLSGDLEMSDVKPWNNDDDDVSRPKPTHIAMKTTRVGTFGPTNGDPFSNQSFLTLKS